MAELLPGLGEDGELHIRESLLLQVAEDPHRLTVREILDSGPDEDFAEYRYGALLLKYLLDERPLVFAELSRQVQAGARRFPQLLEPGISEGYEAFVSAQLELHRGARRPALIVAAH